MRFAASSLIALLVLLLPGLAKADLADRAVSAFVNAACEEGASAPTAAADTIVGQAYQRATVLEDVRELLRSRKFITADADARLGPDGRAIVTFNVQEKPSITAVELDGNRVYENNELFGLLAFTAGDLLERRRVPSERQLPYMLQAWDAAIAAGFDPYASDEDEDDG